jgi:hypothetical protein
MTNEVMLTGTVTDQWQFDFEADLDPGFYRLPNGVLVYLPARGGPSWPKRETSATFARLQNEAGQAHYRVLLVPNGKDSHSLLNWLIGQAAESALSKIGAVMLGGIQGAITAGLATVLVPSEIAKTVMWKNSSEEGPVYGVTSGF